MRKCLELRKKYWSVDKWMTRLLRKSSSEDTEYSYLTIFGMFLKRTNLNPDELITNWNKAFEDQASTEPMTCLSARGRLEVLKKKYKEIIHTYIDDLGKLNNYSCSYIRTQGCVLISFFRHNGIDLGLTPDDLNIADCPNTTSKKLLKREMIAKIIDAARVREKAFFSSMKDSLLRPHTLCKLTYGTINRTGEQMNEELPFEISFEAWLRDPEKVPCVLIDPSPSIVKTRIRHHTWIGTETLEHLKTYFEARRNGSRKVPPETITADSPLFRKSRRITIDAEGRLVPEFANKVSVGDRFSDICYQLGYKHKPRELELYDLKDWGYTQAGKGVDDRAYISHWAGHKVKGRKPNERNYFRPPITDSREQYIKAMPFLSLEKITPNNAKVKAIEQENIILKQLLHDLRNEFIQMSNKTGYTSNTIKKWKAEGEATK